MIFITLGSQKFQFDRLLIKIDELIESGIITEPVFAQIGYSSYLPKHYAYEPFLNRSVFSNHMKTCDTVITHGGTGAIISAVKQHKNVVAVPRLARYHEHVDDHQLQLLQQFDGMNLIIACYQLENLGEKLQEAQHTSFASYESNTGRIIESLEEFIATMR